MIDNRGLGYRENIVAAQAVTVFLVVVGYNGPEVCLSAFQVLDLIVAIGDPRSFQASRASGYDI